MLSLTFKKHPNSLTKTIYTAVAKYMMELFVQLLVALVESAVTGHISFYIQNDCMKLRHPSRLWFFWFVNFMQHPKTIVGSSIVGTGM